MGGIAFWIYRHGHGQAVAAAGAIQLSLGLAIGLIVAAASPAVAGNLFVLDQLDKDVKEFDATTGAFLGSFGETATELSTVRSMACHTL